MFLCQMLSFVVESVNLAKREGERLYVFRIVNTIKSGLMINRRQLCLRSVLPFGVNVTEVQRVHICPVEVLSLINHLL